MRQHQKKRGARRERTQLILLCLEPDVTKSTGYSYVSTNPSIDNLIE